MTCRLLSLLANAKRGEILFRVGKDIPHQVLHRVTACLAEQELRCGDGTEGEALAVVGFVGEGEAVGLGVGHHAVDAVHLADAGHINI